MRTLFLQIWALFPIFKKGQGRPIPVPPLVTRLGDSHTCVHWYFAKQFLELSYHFFSKSKSRIFNELHVSVKVKKPTHFVEQKYKL